MQSTELLIAESAMRTTMRLLMAANGKYIEPEAPLINLILACGARFHGAYSPASDEAQISIRTHRRIRLSGRCERVAEGAERKQHDITVASPVASRIP